MSPELEPGNWRGGVTLSSPGWAGECGEYQRGEDRYQTPYSGKTEPAVGEVGGGMGRGGVRAKRALPTQAPVSSDLETGEDDISDVPGTQRLELRGDRTFSTPTGELSGVLQKQAGGPPMRGIWASPCGLRHAPSSRGLRHIGGHLPGHSPDLHDRHLRRASELVGQRADGPGAGSGQQGWHPPPPGQPKASTGGRGRATAPGGGAAGTGIAS